jgi:hypothetical protein
MPRLLCCVFLSTAFTPEPIRIAFDEGGPIDFYLYRWASYRGTGVQVIIDGACFSACTMFTSLPTVCITERAILLFHRGTNKRATKVMRSFWPPELRVLVDVYGALPRNDSDQFISIGFEELKIILPICHKARISRAPTAAERDRRRTDPLTLKGLAHNAKAP